MKAGPKVGNRFEEGEVTPLKWALHAGQIHAGQIVHMIFTDPIALRIRGYLFFFDSQSTILFGGNANNVIATQTMKNTPINAANAITPG